MECMTIGLKQSLTVCLKDTGRPSVNRLTEAVEVCCGGLFRISSTYENLINPKNNEEMVGEEELEVLVLNK